MYQLIVLAILLGLFYAMYGLKPNTKALITQKLKKIMIVLGLLILAALVATGKLSLLLAPILPALILLQRYTPLLQRFFPNMKQQSKRQEEKPGRKSNTKMDKDEAYQVLGLEPGVSNEKIIETHRRLMQKLHPDRGGSDYLATKLNQARDVLLKR